MKVVIVGGVAGGASAAARLRRLDETAEIIIFEKSGYISYANCGLPYYVGGIIRDKEALTLQTPQSFYNRFNIKANVNCEVTAIERDQKRVSVKNLITGEIFTESYDKLILSPGALPVVPSFCHGGERVFTLRTVEDAIKLKAFCKEKNVKSAAVIGGGFIGLEIAENLMDTGASVTLFERSDHVLAIVDDLAAAFVHNELRAHGVDLQLKADTLSLKTADGCAELVLSDDRTMRFDMAVVAIGVYPDSSLAVKAGLKTGVKGAIAVNKNMQTSDPDIYAVGDAVEISALPLKNSAVIALAGPANKQGRIAADNIAGINSEYQDTQGASVIKVFSKTVASVGATEKQLKTAGVAYEKIILSAGNHAGYYPGASGMTIQCLYSKDSGLILGAQIVGGDGVDKRIDVLSVAMRVGLKAAALKDLELAYAPPYSSAKDPVNMIGFIADNIEKGIVKQFYYEDLDALKNNADALFIDARTPFEYVRGHADGFINIPLDDMRYRLDEIDKTKTVYVMCQSGLRSYLATRILAQNGYDVYNFAGGYMTYAALKNHEYELKECLGCGMEKR